MLTSVRSIIQEHNINMQAVLYVTGKQEMGKTTLVSRIAGIYQDVSDRKIIGLVQAGTTAAAMDDLLITLRDQPLIVDDLCLSAGKSVARKRRELGAAVIRQGTGQQPILKKRGKKCIRFQCVAGVILTAEFTLDNMSDLTRCLIVPLTEQLYLADELTPDVIGDAVRMYSEWFSLHAQEEIETLHQSLKQKNVMDLEPRVFTNYICLGWAFSALKRCMAAQGLPQSTLDSLTDRMNHAILLSIEVHDQLRRELLDKEPLGNIAWCILRGFQEQCFDLCKNIDKLQKHDGILWRDDLCLRPEALISFLHQQPGYQDIHKSKITRYLKDNRALAIQEDETDTVHLKKSTKEQHIPRVYRIQLSVLHKIAKQY